MNDEKVMQEPDFNFGRGYLGRKVGWYPDRELNPQYADTPDHDFVALELQCGPHRFTGAVTLNRDLPGQHSEAWVVEQEDPLTLSPSIQASCGCHGFIREGKWVDA